MMRNVMQRQMFKGGGQAVPNQYKGFSKLPESVQQKMNPALARQYQEGGIASMMDPASMPQGSPMAGGQMDPAQMAMMEAEALGQAQGEQLGAMVGEQTMSNLDQAEDFKGAIDAIRGNNAPLEARYKELSEYVGPQDAMQTPESVLAMVQPTIMMTEEGAVDSGIGQLMQQITGNTAMETPDGQPTAMAEGVGSLMGVGQQPAEKKFLADGGAVIGMSNGGNPFYEQALAEQQAILGDPQQSKDFMQSQILFNIADRGLAFAGGVDPRTGESMAGAPFLSQLGRAGAGLGATIGEQVAQQTAQERAVRAAALQRAQSLSDIKDDRAFQLELAGAKTKEATVKNIPVSIFNTLSKKAQNKILGLSEDVKGIPRDLYDSFSDKDKKIIVGVLSVEEPLIKGVPKSVYDTLSKSAKERLLGVEDTPVKGVPRDIFDKMSEDDQNKLMNIVPITELDIKGIPKTVFDELSEADKNRVLVGDPEGVNGVPRDIFDKLSKDEKKKVILGDPQQVKGIPRNIFDGLSADVKKSIVTSTTSIKGIPAQLFNTFDDDTKKKLLGYKEPEIKGIPESFFKRLSESEQKKVMGVTADLDHVVINNDLIVFNKDTKESSVLFDGEKERKSLKIFQDRDDESKFYNSYDGGDSYMVEVTKTKNGITVTERQYRQMPDNVVPINDLEAYKVVKEETRVKKAEEIYKNSIGSQIDNLNELSQRTFRFDQNGNRIENTIIATEEELKAAEEVLRNSQDYVDPMKDALEGTGFYGTLWAAANNIGGIFGSYGEWIGEDTAIARQNLVGLITLGRTALIVSPRLPVFELQRVEQVFPSLAPTKLNAQTEANKLVTLKAMLLQQKSANIKNLTKTYSDPTVIDDIQRNNVEIDNLLHKLRGVPGPGETSLPVSSGAGDANTQDLQLLEQQMGPNFGK